MDFSLILPTYNEKENVVVLIPNIIQILEAEKLKFEIIVVDDDSKDLTWKIVEDLFSSDDRIRVLRRIEKKGLSSAVIDGMSIAKGKYLGVMDADMQHDETILPKMIAELSTYEIVVGSRVVEDGGYGEWGSIRKSMSIGATLLAKAFFDIPIKDPMSGYFVIRRELFNELIEEINPRGFKILLEFIARKKGIKAKEVGYVFKTRIHGETKMSKSVIINYLVALYDIRFGKYISLTFLKYGLTGLSGVFVNLLGQYIGVNLFKLSPDYTTIDQLDYSKPFLSVVLGFELSVLSNYIINNLWTFRVVQLKGFINNILGFIKFNLVSVVGLLIQLSVWRFTLQYALTQFNFFSFDQLSYLCNFIGIIFATAGNYYLNRNFTWKYLE